MLLQKNKVAIYRPLDNIITVQLITSTHLYK